MGLWTDFNLEQRRLHAAALGNYAPPDLDPWGGLIPKLRASDAASLVNYWTEAMGEHDATPDTQTNFQNAIDLAQTFSASDSQDPDLLSAGTALAYWNAFQHVSQDMDAHAAAVSADELNTVLRAFGDALGEVPQTIGAAAGAVVSGVATGLEAFLANLSGLGGILLLVGLAYAFREKEA